jgi:hypothetical protein
VRLIAAVAVERGTGRVADVLERAVSEVPVDVVGPRVVGHQQVELPVVVHVEPRDAEAVEASLVGDAGPGRDVGERAVVVVVEQVIERGRQPARAAHHFLAAIPAGGGASRVGGAHADLAGRG